MAREFDTQIKFGVTDNATPRIRSLSAEFRRMSSARETLGIQSERNIQREIYRTIASYNRLERSGTMSAAEQSRAFEKMQSTVAKLRQEMAAVERQQLSASSIEFRRMSSARETLGIRSERNIQREIARTIASYNRLERSGTMSASDQTRAFEKMQSTVAKLRQEMAGAERQQRSWGKAALSIGSGIAAGAMTLRKPINDQASYSMHLAELSNLAFNKEDVAGRITGKKQLDASIRKALRLGGGTPEQAFAALQSMIRSGSMTVTEAQQSLPGVMMNASATASDPEAVANLQASAYNFGLSKKDALSALSVTTTAAQHGRVGVPLLAREMPKALESAKSAGFKGRAGFSQVAALFEAAAIGAGTPEEAATNVTNLLAELTSSNLSNNAKHITIKGKGVDFKALSVKDASKGLTPLDTVNNLVDTALKYDKNYQGLGKKLANTKDEGERSSLEAQRDLIEGQYISQLFPNQYSKNAFQLYRRQIPYFNKLQHEQMAQFDLPAEKRSAELDFDLIKQEPEFQMHQAQNEKLFATNDAIAPVAKTLGDLADYSSKLAQEFPGLTTAAAGAAVAITALGAAAAVKSGADLLMGRGGGVTAGKAGGGVLGKLKGLFGKGGASVAEGAATAGKAAGTLKWVPFLGEAAMAYQGSQDFPLIDIQRGKDQAAEARAKGGESNPAMMALMPKSAGALDALDEIRKWFSGSGQDKPADKAAAAAPAPAAPTVNLTVTLDGREIATAVEQRFDRDGRRK